MYPPHVFNCGSSLIHWKMETAWLVMKAGQNGGYICYLLKTPRGNLNLQFCQKIKDVEVKSTVWCIRCQTSDQSWSYMWIVKCHGNNFLVLPWYISTRWWYYFWILMFFCLNCSWTSMVVSVNSQMSCQIYTIPTMDTLHSVFWKSLALMHSLLSLE